MSSRGGETGILLTIGGGRRSSLLDNPAQSDWQVVFRTMDQRDGVWVSFC